MSLLPRHFPSLIHLEELDDLVGTTHHHALTCGPLSRFFLSALLGAYNPFFPHNPNYPFLELLINFFPPPSRCWKYLWGMGINISFFSIVLVPKAHTHTHTYETQK